MLHTKFHPPKGSGAPPPAALTVEELSAIGALDEIHPVDAAHMIAGGLVAMGDEAMTLAFSRGKGLGLATALVALSLNTGTTLEQLREQGASVKEQQKAGSSDLFQRAATLASSSALTAHDRVVALLTLHTILNSASAALVILRQARDEHDGAQVRDISPEDMARIAAYLRENRDRIDAMMGETIVDLAAKHGMTAEDIDEIIALTTDHPKKEHS